MKKCLVACLLAITFLVMCLPVGAADVATFTINVPEELPKAGDKFKVTVNLSDHPGFCAIQYTLVYDKEQMECTRAQVGELVENMLNVANPKADIGAIIAGATTTPVEENGTVGIFTFKAKNDIAAFAFELQDLSLVGFDKNKISYQVVVNSGEQGDTTTENELEQAPDNESGIVPDNETVDEPVETLPEDEPTENLPEEDEKESTSAGGTQQGGNVTVKPDDSNKPAEEKPAEPTAKPELPEKDEEMTVELFADVTGHWGASYINEAAEKGLFKGDENGNFNPDANVTRAQFITVLWRMAGTPEATAEAPFTDIENQIPEFKSAIAWGYEKGYINGTSETTFDPSGTLTREAGMKILHYYAGGKVDKEQFLYAVYDGIFEDSAEIATWAKPSVYWGIYNKLISGTSETTLTPKGTATRAQLAKILVNYLNS